MSTFSIKGIRGLSRMHSNGTPINAWTLAAYHHPESITWRWAIYCSRRVGGKPGFYCMRVYRGQGFNVHAGVNIPFIGSLSLQMQPHMFPKVRS